MALLKGMRSRFKELGSGTKASMEPLLTYIEADVQAALNVESHASAGNAARSEIVTALEHFDDLVGRFTCSQCRERKWKRGEDDVYSCPCRASVFPLAKSSATPAGPA